MRKCASVIFIFLLFGILGGCITPPSPPIVQGDVLSGLQESDSLVWGYIDTTRVKFLQQKVMTAQKTDTDKKVVTVPMLEGKEEWSVREGLFPMIGLGREYATLTFINLDTNKSFITEVRAHRDLQPFVLALPAGKYRLTVDLPMGDRHFVASSTQILDCPGCKSTIYIGDLHVYVVNDLEALLYDDGD